MFFLLWMVIPITMGLTVKVEKFKPENVKYGFQSGGIRAAGPMQIDLWWPQAFRACPPGAAGLRLALTHGSVFVRLWERSLHRGLISFGPDGAGRQFRSIGGFEGVRNDRRSFTAVQDDGAFPQRLLVSANEMPLRRPYGTGDSVFASLPHTEVRG